MYNDDFLNKKLQQRKDVNAFRKLRLPENKIDFCSNDYLGIVKNGLLNNEPEVFCRQLKTGSTGSRLLAGNYELIEEAEKGIASFHEAEAALIFNSGYDANIGILSSVTQKGDAVFYDNLAHASMRDGIRLSFAQSFSYLHNDLNDLEIKLSHSEGNKFIITESVFSMDGDMCPLNDLVQLAKKYKAHIILDEAHAIGIVGEKGEGLAQHLHLHKEIFCRLYTFGKACGCHGAAVLGTNHLKDYLINFARSFIYSTALPEHSVAIIQKSYNEFPNMKKEREHLKQLVNIFQSSQINYPKLNSQTPVQILLVPGNEQAKKIADNLQQNNIDVRAIVYPTVPLGKERLRIILHAFNTIKDLNNLIDLLKD